MNVADGHEFEDKGWCLADPEASSPSLVRAVYDNRHFTPREDLEGIYRYAEWMPVRKILKKSCAPVTYRSKGLASLLGLDNLYITFSGWNPRIGAKMRTGSFKETEAYSVLSRLDDNEKRILVVQSAGNTARAFAQVCSDNRIPIVICVPSDNLHDLWFRKPLNKCVKIVAVPHGCDYYDAIAVGEKLATDPMFLIEGGAKNVARRDGMATTVLSAAQVIGRIPDSYFQAVGSGTGTIAAYESNLRLLEDGRFGDHLMKLIPSQNIPFVPMYDAFKADSRTLLPFDEDQARVKALEINAKVLSNRKPPYGIVGGLYDVLKATKGDMEIVTNEELAAACDLFEKLEGCDIHPAAGVAVESLRKAIASGKVKKDEVIMLNITGGGERRFKSEHKWVSVEPHLVMDASAPAEEVIAAVDKLF